MHNVTCQLLRAYAHARAQVSRTDADLVFDTIDRDCSGAIEYMELEKLLRRAGPALRLKMAETETAQQEDAALAATPCWDTVDDAEGERPLSHRFVLDEDDEQDLPRLATKLWQPGAKRDVVSDCADEFEEVPITVSLCYFVNQ